MQLRVLVAAGGTGGHIFPALAVVNVLRDRMGTDLAVHWIGSSNRMESEMIPKLGIPYTAMPIRGFRKVLSASTFQLPIRLAWSVAIAWQCIRRFNPDVIIVTGAYISYPVGLAAKMLGVPYVVMESNVNVGKSNQKLLAAASAIVLSYSESVQQLPPAIRSNAFVLGNPVRFDAAPACSRQEAASALNLSPDLPIVFIMGGSLGARSINQAVQEMVYRWTEHGKAPFQIFWQTGSSNQVHVPDSLAPYIHSVEFVENMEYAYVAANIVVGRSGATTLAELSVLGRPAILIPLPSASMGEQLLNARAAEAREAAIVLDDATLQYKLESTIVDLLDNADKRDRMAKSITTMGKPQAANDVADLLVRIAGTVQ